MRAANANQTRGRGETKHLFPQNLRKSADTMSETGEPDVKKVKLSTETTTEEKNGQIKADKHRFAGFNVDRVLSDRPREKVICVTGKFEGSGSDAVVILEKTPFTKDSVEKMLSESTSTDVTLQNDIYSTFQCMPANDVNVVKTTLIYPATEKHIDKNTSQDICMITETPEDYTQITLPHIEGSQFNTKWVYNILEKKKESERIVFEDADPETGFILLPDMKWDGKQVEDLYLVAIIHRHGIKSLRDLTADHLPLLRNIRDKGTAAIKDKYGVGGDKLRVYFHYQPSYYHLHMHFTHVRFDAPGSGIGRAVALQDVVNNLEVASDYYKKATLCFTTGVRTPLSQQYAEAKTAGD